MYSAWTAPGTNRNHMCQQRRVNRGHAGPIIYIEDVEFVFPALLTGVSFVHSYLSWPYFYLLETDVGTCGKYTLKPACLMIDLHSKIANFN